MSAISGISSAVSGYIASPVATTPSGTGAANGTQAPTSLLGAAQAIINEVSSGLQSASANPAGVYSPQSVAQGTAAQGTTQGTGATQDPQVQNAVKALKLDPGLMFDQSIVNSLTLENGSGGTTSNIATSMEGVLSAYLTMKSTPTTPTQAASAAQAAQTATGGSTAASAATDQTGAATATSQATPAVDLYA